MDRRQVPRQHKIIVLAAVIAALEAFSAPALGQSAATDNLAKQNTCTPPAHLAAFGQLMNTALYKIEPRLDEGDLNGALTALGKLDNGALLPFDQAMLRYYRGYTRARAGDLPAAAAEYQEALDQAPMPDHFSADVRKALAALERSETEAPAWVASHPAAVRKAALYRPLNFVAPIYPRKAFNRHIEGRVVLTFSISEKGDVQDARVVKAEPRGYFERSAISALRKSKYEPVLVCGQRVLIMALTKTINYKIAD